MTEFLTSIIELDKILFHYINYQWQNELFDIILPILRDKKFWIPVYGLIIVFFALERRKRAVLPILFLILTVSVTDTVSAKLVKESVQRVRPCKAELELEKRVLVRCGSGYSFTSNHAANHFALSIFLVFLLRHEKRWIRWAIILWAALISYSQVYVGVHYPVDVLSGGILGTIIALIMYRIYRVFS